MAILKNAINALDPAPDRKKELTLLLSLLSELCEQKVTEFTNAIEEDIRTAGTAENRSIPVSEILAKHTEYRAYVSADAGKIATEVGGAIKKFVAGGSDEIIDGIASLLTTGLEAIIGAGKGIQQEMSSYYIVVQGLAIARYDVKIWSRYIEASGITSQIEHALAVAAYKSSVDVTKVSLNTFLLAYERQLQEMQFTPQQQIEYIDYAEKLYDRLTGAKMQAGDGGAPALVYAGTAKDFRAPGELSGSLWD
ncbi:hypothetical protein [Sphingorhabdus sp. Alg239-R122]|uniref:hypothetical protein n=1 Tax=Sphingorhabdus sp. Alg239-R122 TaxID=2305989 RepID=UPI0013DA35E3|nr:hypothetical protein [Sphingorhabdus sp. Alg239-R122]